MNLKIEGIDRMKINIRATSMELGKYVKLLEPFTFVPTKFDEQEELVPTADNPFKTIIAKELEEGTIEIHPNQIFELLDLLARTFGRNEIIIIKDESQYTIEIYDSYR